MERDESGPVSKKQRVDSSVSVDIPNHEEGEASSKVVETESPKAKFVVDDDVIYRLYFKGMQQDEWGSAGYGVAICDPTDKLLFEFKEQLSENWMGNKAVELRALVRGLKESLDVGIKKLVICCNNDQIYQNLIKRKRSFQKLITFKTYNAKERRDFKELREEVGRLRNFFASSEVTQVGYKDVKFANELARDVRVTQTSSGGDDYDCDADWSHECDCDFHDSPPRVRDEDNYNYDYL